MLCSIAKSPCNPWLKQKIAPCFLCGVTDRAMRCYSGVVCVLGGFPRAAIRVTAMNRGVCMRKQHCPDDLTLRKLSAQVQIAVE